MYFVEGSNAPVISQEIFNQAQKLRESRTQGRTIKVYSKRALSGKVSCGCCNTLYRYKAVNKTAYWICTKHDENKELCPVKPVAEKELYAAFLRFYYKMKHYGAEILLEMCAGIGAIRKRRMLWSEDAVALNRKLSDLSSQNQMLAQLRQQGLIDPDIYIQQSNELAGQLGEVKRKKEQLLEQEGDHTITQTRELLEILEAGPDYLDAFDLELFDELIDRIIVESNTRIRFRLKNGLELAETIERTMR